MENFVSVGSILKPHGLNGELKARIKYIWKDAREYPGHFFVQDNDKFLPYFVKKLQSPVPYQVIVKFEELHSREDVLKLGKRKLYIPADQVSDYFEDSDDGYLKLTGYAASEQEHGELGEITEVIEMPAQYVALVQHQSGKEIMIPLVDKMIEQIDEKKRKVHFKLPDGLIALYLE